MPLSRRICSVGADDAKSHLSSLLAKVEAGEEITITRHGSPIAKLVPVRKKVTAGNRKAAIQRIQKLGASLGLGGLTTRALINDGRK